MEPRHHRSRRRSSALVALRTSNLIDGSLVTVSLTGFSAGAGVAVDECGQV